MADVLVYADTLRSPEMRHEVPLMVPDPFLYAETGDRRLVLVHAAEGVRMEGLGLDVHAPEEFGVDELRAAGLSRPELARELAIRACLAWGVTSALVPGTFPLDLADALRARGVELEPDGERFVERRRVKTANELAGIGRATAAADAALAAIAGRIAEGVTSEELKRVIAEVVADHDCAVDETIVSHGAQTAVAHEPGSGPIAAGEPVVVDLGPRDRVSGCHTDMTRTFVAGEPPARLLETHALVREALDVALREIRPGAKASDVNAAVCDLFEAQGHATPRTKRSGVPLLDGFFHALGHGVGLEIHEYPVLDMSETRELLEGEVLAVEPGLYDPAWGGVRLEDVVLVTADGAERLGSHPHPL